MKIFKNKFLVKLIVSLCLFFMLIGIGTPSKVFAAKKDDDQIWGGKLLSPVIDLLTALADGAMEILHDSVQEQEAAFIRIDSDSSIWDRVRNVLAVVLAIILAVIAVTAVLAISGGVAAGAAALAKTIGVGTKAVKAAFVIGAAGATGTALTVGVVAGVAAGAGMVPDDIYLPAFSISAEEIFKNKVALFDINFFNPNKYYSDRRVEKPDNITDEDSEQHGASDIVSVFKQLFDGEDDLKFTDAREYVEALGSEKTISVQEAKSGAFAEIINLTNAKLSSENKIKDDMSFKIYTPILNLEGPNKINLGIVAR